MNTITTTKITRPPNISENDPVPVPLNNTFVLKCEALYTNGQPMDLTDAKFYFHIKTALADADGSAKITKNSDSNPTSFVTNSAALGLYTVVIPAGEFVTATMTADTNYYVDTEIITSDGSVFTHIYDTIRMFKQVTTAIA